MVTSQVNITFPSKPKLGKCAGSFVKGWINIQNLHLKQKKKKKKKKKISYLYFIRKIYPGNVK